MAGWLAELGVADAAMESTGVYWWPVYHALAQAGIEVCVCNAAHMRNVPGRKTDLRDCQQLAELHEYGLLRTGFIPGAQVAALRQRTRYRKKLTGQRSSEGQRLAKVLEDAGIKTGLGGQRHAGQVRPGDDRGADRLGSGTRPGWPGWPWACCAARPRSWRWPATAGSPRAMPRCAGCTYIAEAGAQTRVMPVTCQDINRAGDGNRTRIASLEGWSSTIELRPQPPPNRRLTPVAYRLTAPSSSTEHQNGRPRHSGSDHDPPLITNAPGPRRRSPHRPRWHSGRYWTTGAQCLTQKFALGKDPPRLPPPRPAACCPDARAGPQGSHSRPVLPNAHSTEETRSIWRKQRRRSA